VSADANQIIQAILNVCINSCDAMPDGGDLAIECRIVTLGKESAFVKSGLNPGKFVLIRIQDTGTGIPDGIKDKLFEPFFTTKEKEKGTGLGLYVTLNIIKEHNGHISIASEEGVGSTVDIYLPASDKTSRPAVESIAFNAKFGEAKSVLIVDDEEDFLDMISETMQDSGYKTFVANVGGEALELYTKHKNEIDLVILDIMMPGMDGGEVYRELRKIAPDVKVVLCSGYSNIGRAEDLMKEGVAGFLQKPFVFNELEYLIASVLSA